MPDPDYQQINRSGLFVLSSQLEGLCAALRHTVPNGLQPGHGTAALLKKLYDDFDEIHTGAVLDRFPAIDGALTPVDLLTIAETLRATVVAFLTPEEREERKQVFGFTTPTPLAAPAPPNP